MTTEETTETTSKPDSITLASERAAISKDLATPQEEVEASPIQAEEPEPEVLEPEEENEEELEVVASEPEKPKKKGGFQKRIDKLTGRLTAAEQEREYWRSEALRVQQTKATEKPPETALKQDLSKRPKAEDYKTADEYQEALTDWKVDQRLASERQKARDEAVKSEFQTKVQKHNERIKALAPTKDDWSDVEQVFRTTPLSITVQEAILDSDDSAALVYELGKDSKELERICKLGAVAAAKAIGKIEARLSKPSNP
ncbi:MAG: hypothetical protein ACYDBV_14755, partial [Nitrospiria bacterium]